MMRAFLQENSPYQGQGHENANTFKDMQTDPFGRQGRSGGRASPMAGLVMTEC